MRIFDRINSKWGNLSNNVQGLIIFLSVMLILGPILYWIISENDPTKPYKLAPVVLETRLGIESEYAGYKITYTGLTHSSSHTDDINLLINGKPLLLSPGYDLGSVQPDLFPRYGFFLPNGQKLFLKEVSRDRSILKWAEEPAQ